MNFFEEEHIFIFSLLGRTSSTALQRILNSSNEIFIYGESWGIFETIIDFFSEINERNENIKCNFPNKEKEFEKLLMAFQNKQHDIFYANAFPSVEKYIELNKKSIFELFKPPFDSVKRIGVKEISMRKMETPFRLIKLFPKCKLVFLFRNPIDQWISVSSAGWWHYSHDIEVFLNSYEKFAEKIKAIIDKTDSIIIENLVLYDYKSIKKLCDMLNINQFDQSLVGKIISSERSKTLYDREKKQIIESNAYRYFKLLRTVSTIDAQKMH